MSEPFVIEQKQADGSYQQLIPLGYINRNEFDNGDFKINQRGVSGTISTPGYFIDRWKLVSGTVTLTANGLALNGTISQILPTAIGAYYSASIGMYSGTATVTYDNDTATGTITSSGGTIKWVKLEIGEVPTPYVPKGYGAELAECQRYFIPRVGFRAAGIVNGSTFSTIIYTPATMRTEPTITVKTTDNVVFNGTFKALTGGVSSVGIKSNGVYADFSIAASGVSNQPGIAFALSVDLSADL